MPETAEFKARLEAQLEELEARQARIAEDLAEPLNADSGEQAVEMEDDASLEGQGALIARELASVKRALARRPYASCPPGCSRWFRQLCPPAAPGAHGPRGRDPVIH